MLIGTLVTKITSDYSGLEKGAMASKTLLEGIGRSARRTGMIMSAALTAPIMLLGRQAVRAASDAEEIHNLYSVAFRGIADEAEAMTLSIQKEFHLARSSAEEFLARTADLMAGMEMTERVGLDLSAAVTRLGLDLASLQNKSPQQAVMALTKALLGERESLALLGVKVTENNDKFKEYVKVMKNLNQHSDEHVLSMAKNFDGFAKILPQLRAMGPLTDMQAKSVATLLEAYRQSPNAVGDFQRSMSSVANQSKSTGEAMKSLRESIGNMIIGATQLGSLMQKMSGGLESLEKRISRLSPFLQKLIVWSTILLAAIGPLLLFVGQLSLGLNALIPFLVKAIPIISAWAASLSFSATAVATLSTAIALLPLGLVLILGDYLSRLGRQTVDLYADIRKSQISAAGMEREKLLRDREVFRNIQMRMGKSREEADILWRHLEREKLLRLEIEKIEEKRRQQWGISESIYQMGLFKLNEEMKILQMSTEQGELRVGQYQRQIEFEKELDDLRKRGLSSFREESIRMVFRRLEESKTQKVVQDIIKDLEKKKNYLQDEARFNSLIADFQQRRLEFQEKIRELENSGAPRDQIRALQEQFNLVQSMERMKRSGVRDSLKSMMEQVRFLQIQLRHGREMAEVDRRRQEFAKELKNLKLLGVPPEVIEKMKQLYLLREQLENQTKTPSPENSRTRAVTAFTAGSVEAYRAILATRNESKTTDTIAKNTAKTADNTGMIVGLLKTGGIPSFQIG